MGSSHGGGVIYSKFEQINEFLLSHGQGKINDRTFPRYLTV